MDHATEAELELIDATSNTGFPSLQINDGQVFSISSGSKLSLGSVVVAKGGQIVIEGPAKSWTEITIHGDLLLLGKMVIQGFRRAESEAEVFTGIAADGRQLSFIYQHVAQGGRGGKGVDNPTIRRGVGGAGSTGSAHYGGGGGGGAGLGGRGPTGTNGSNGVGREGGIGGSGACDSQVCGARGGRGGEGGGTDILDGGLVYLRVHGRVDATGGEVLGAGLPGAQGGAGENADARHGGQGGGGGGGAPGGHGGCFIAAVSAAHIGSLPVFAFGGGPGGQGGAGGTGWQGVAESGTQGSQGGNGKCEIYDLDDGTKIFTHQL